MIIMCIFVGILSIFLICSILYIVIGWFKPFFHDILEWHRPDTNKDEYYDGCSIHATCKHCGKDIMQDSQGNWF